MGWLPTLASSPGLPGLYVAALDLQSRDKPLGRPGDEASLQSNIVTYLVHVLTQQYVLSIPQPNYHLAEYIRLTGLP